MTEYSDYIEARDAFVALALDRSIKNDPILFRGELRKKRIQFARARDVWEEYMRRHPVLRRVSEWEEAIAIDKKINILKERELYNAEIKRLYELEKRRESKRKTRERRLKSLESGGYDISEPIYFFHGTLSSLPKEEYTTTVLEVAADLRSLTQVRTETNSRRAQDVRKIRRNKNR